MIADRALWTYAVAVYEKPGVREACLALQDRLGVDVVMILFCLWLGARKAEAPTELTQVIVAASQRSLAWHRAVVEPLRACRRYLKAPAMDGIETGGVKDLRERVKSCELDAERIQILSLAHLAETCVGEALESPMHARQRAGDLLKHYFAAAGIAVDHLGQAEVVRILDHAYN